MADSITITDLEDAKLDVNTIEEIATSILDTATDRIGNTKNTLNGALKLLGYKAPVVYAGSILFTVSDNTKTIDETGIIYGPKPSELPFTTSGTFVGDDDDRFYVIQGLSSDGVFTTKTQMIADVTLNVGVTVITQGYSAAGDGGGATYLIAAAQPVDGYGDHLLSNGNVALLQSVGTLRSEQYGANGANDLLKLDAMLTKAAGKPCDVSAMSSLSGVISGHAKSHLVGTLGQSVTLANIFQFDGSNGVVHFENLNFDASAVPNGVSVAVYIFDVDHFQCINSGVTNAPRGNMLVSRVNTVEGWGGDFSDSGQEMFVSGSVNQGVGLNLYGIRSRCRWHGPIANDCWQIGVFINGDVTEICYDTVVYDAQVKSAQDNGIRVQPGFSGQDMIGTEDCGFINPTVDGCVIDNIRINGTRSFCHGGISTNAAQWGCKVEGGVDITIKDLVARGNGGGIGARVTKNLYGLTVTGCDTEVPVANVGLYMIQVEALADVHDVTFQDNITRNVLVTTTHDLAIICSDRAKCKRLYAINNTYMGRSTSNHREVWGKADLCKSIGNGTTEGGANRGYINISNCDKFTVSGFTGHDDSGVVLWGMEVNNGSTLGVFTGCAFLNMVGAFTGGTDLADMVDIGGNYLTP